MAPPRLKWIQATVGQAIQMIPVEDVLGLREQPNLPGTIDEHPNWRRRMPDSSARLFDGPIAHAVCAAIDQTRNRT